MDNLREELKKLQSEAEGALSRAQSASESISRLVPAQPDSSVLMPAWLMWTLALIAGVIGFLDGRPSTILIIGCLGWLVAWCQWATMEINKLKQVRTPE